jgi:Protein of unknown function (DUF4019)
MMAAVGRGRRTLLVAAAAIAAGVLPLSLAAQDARSAAAQNAAREWLVLTDRLDGAASWNAAGAKFRSASPVDRWTDALKQVRGPLGALATRAVDSTRFAQSFPGFPVGDYAMIVFRTSFANKTVSRETITLEREGDAWRVVGYAIA